jgi:hypothetical protein
MTVKIRNSQGRTRKKNIVVVFKIKLSIHIVIVRVSCGIRLRECTCNLNLIRTYFNNLFVHPVYETITQGKLQYNQHFFASLVYTA